VSLRYGYVSSGLRDHRLDDALELLAAHGYAGIALTLDHVHLDPQVPRGRLRRLRERLAALGLSCVVETGGRFVLDPRRKHFPTLMSEGRERRLALLCRAVDVAAELEAPVMSTWSGAAPPGVALETAWRRLLDGCACVLAHASRAGVKVGFEPEPGMLVERVDDYDRLERELGFPPQLGMTLDVGHCVCLEPDPPDACVRRAGARLVHAHIEDMVRGVHEHLMFGEGELDTASALAALCDVGFTGMVAVELSRHAHTAHTVVPAAIAHLHSAERAV
jgi:sugar phosphate isomerase/epimerase